MEIGQHGIRRPESITRMNEQSRLSPYCRHRGLDGANTRGAHAESPLRSLDKLGVAVRDFKMLLVQLDIFDPLFTQRCERSESHVQSDVSDVGSGLPALFKHCRGEMQARRWRCRRPGVSRKNSLISIAVGCARLSFDIGRQRHFPIPLEQLINQPGRYQAHSALAKLAFFQYFSRKLIAEKNPVSGARPLGRLHQTLPNVCFLLAQEQNFQFRAGWMVAASMQAGWKNARIIQDQAIAHPKIFAEIAKRIVMKRLRLSRDHQHPRTSAFGWRLLRDQFARQIIIEIGNLQTLILGIESSCDETAAAVVEEGGRIRSSVIASQFDVHTKYGGVVPELASREHLRAIVPVVNQSLEQAGVSLGDLAAIAVTSGPGLVGSLLVGVTYAKALCFARQIPLIAVHHVEGHIHSVLLAHPAISLPAVALVVSGGHTHLFEIRAIGQYRLLGKTRDDAAGEAYDKVAKLLGFGYPGGPVIDKLASFGNPHAVKFTVAKMKGNDLDFSFSGHKTAVLRWTQQHNIQAEIELRRTLQNPTFEELLAATPQPTLDLLASFQNTVIEELLRRTTAAALHIGAGAALVAGGVAGNLGLRRRAAESRDLEFYFPDPALATDNAAMIAAAAFPKYVRQEFAGFDLKAQAGLMLA